MMGTAVEFRNVTKTYGSATVLNNLSLKIDSGKLVTLIGPSGCGKTTTLKMINCLIEPTKGEILVEGQSINSTDPVELRRQIGYVIQQIGLFPHMTIEENISLVPRLNGENKAKMKKRADELLDLIGLDPREYGRRYPRELSGGQQQRVGVARALAANPSIILMDEPFSALDPISREQLQDQLVTLQSNMKKTIVFVTHDMDEALKIADEIVLMKDGHLVQVAPPDKLLRHPANDFVRDFVGEKRFQQAAKFAVATDAMIPGVTVGPQRGIAEAVRLMQRHKVNGLIVVSQGGLFLGTLGAHEIYANYGKENLSVENIMQREVMTVTPTTLLSDIVGLLDSSAGGFIPVVNEEMRLQGVVTRGSLIEVIAKAYWEDETDGSMADVSTELE